MNKVNEFTTEWVYNGGKIDTTKDLSLFKKWLSVYVGLSKDDVDRIMFDCDEYKYEKEYEKENNSIKLLLYVFG